MGAEEVAEKSNVRSNIEVARPPVFNEKVGIVRHSSHQG